MRTLALSPWLGICFAFLISLMTAEAQVADQERGGLQVTSPQVLFVFDASQSMYGKIAGTRGNKLDLAKAIMRTALTEWPQAMELGVLAYGHRGRRAPGGNRCRDIQLIVPIAPPNLTEIQSKIEAISAKGTTPICAALEAAGKHLEASTKAGTLVLISDGTEECGGDLIETVRTLAATSVDLTVHILSLDQSEEHNVPLVEMAQLTSGKFFDIRQSDQAEPAIQSILRSIIESVNLTISAHDTWDVETPTTAPITWHLYEGDSQGVTAEITSLRAPKLLFQVTPGVYWITAQREDDLYGFQMHVPLKQAVSRRLSLVPGEVELIPDGIAADVAWKFSLHRAMPGAALDDAPLVSRSNITGTQVVTVPEGAYRLEFQHPGLASPKSMSFHSEAERRHAFDVVFDSE